MSTINGMNYEQWSRLYKAQQASGLTQASWCKEQGISVNTFYKAVSKYGLNKRQGTTTPIVQSESTAPFLELTEDASVSHPEVIIDYNGATLKVHSGCTSSMLKRSLEVIREVLSC